MPVGWMTALKLVPWGDVIEATPQIVQAARRLMGRSADEQAQAQHAATVTLQALQERVAQLEDEQVQSARLIQQLAEQNAQVVRAVEALRVRGQRLLWATVALSAACAVLLAGWLKT
jgi:hypothetical protein